jgi:hypothetical protein
MRITERRLICDSIFSLVNNIAYEKITAEEYVMNCFPVGKQFPVVNGIN